MAQFKYLWIFIWLTWKYRYGCVFFLKFFRELKKNRKNTLLVNVGEFRSHYVAYNLGKYNYKNYEKIHLTKFKIQTNYY